MSQLMSVLKIAGVGIALIVVVIIAGYCFLRFDVMSYTAMGSETLSPVGASMGHALVVYDPGVFGAAKNAATKIAGDLQAKGYTVNLAGVTSSAAGNASGYDVIAIVSPAYWDYLGSSAQSYLQNLRASPEARIGVFATGIIEPGSNDSAYMHKFVTHLPEDSPVKVKSTMKLVTDLNGNAADKTDGYIDEQCSAFVSDLLQ